MQNIFKNLFKKTDKNQKMNCDEQVREFKPLIIRQTDNGFERIDNADNKPAEMTDDEKLSEDKKLLDTLRRELILKNDVLHYIGEHFSCSWCITCPKDYPLMNIGKYNIDTFNYKCETQDDGWYEAFRTMEGAKLYLMEFYKIREEHLKQLFPVETK
jgi:hypothetical protein